MDRRKYHPKEILVHSDFLNVRYLLEVIIQKQSYQIVTEYDSFTTFSYRRQFYCKPLNLKKK